MIKWEIDQDDDIICFRKYIQRLTSKTDSSYKCKLRNNGRNNAGNVFTIPPLAHNLPLKTSLTNPLDA